MKTLFILSILSLPEILWAQHASDTMIKYNYSPGSPYKMKSERYIRTFNESTQPITGEMEKWDGKRKIWRAYIRDTFKYNEQGFLSREDTYLLDSQGKDLRQFKEKTIEYDSVGNHVETVVMSYYYWDWGNLSYSPRSEYRFEGKKLMEERHLEWIWDKWMIGNSKAYEYDISGNLLSLIEQRRSVNTFYPMPVNDVKTVYAYNSNGGSKGSLTYHWDTVQNDWNLFLRKTCIVNMYGKDSVCIYERWKLLSGGWDTTILESFAYDGFGRKVMEKRQVMDNARKKWIESSKSTWVYNAAGCVTVFEWCDEWNPKIKAYAVRHRTEWYSHLNCPGENEVAAW